MKKIVSVLLPLMIVLFLLQMFIQPILFPTAIEAAAYKVGSSDTVVKQIEQKLKWLGFFKGTPDNYYGDDTAEAVRKLQRDRGLKADGVAGDRTLSSLGVTAGQGAVEKTAKTVKKDNHTKSSDTSLLARAINGESRGEPYVGQVAVGAVIMNRVRHPEFPNTIAGVVYQPGAFTAVDDGQINASLESSPTKAANDALNGWDPTGGCIYYYNPAKTTNKWIWSRQVVKIIGKHHFAK
jgi:N-acetylmuramoyl-L-alanine amidase